MKFNIKDNIKKAEESNSLDNNSESNIAVSNNVSGNTTELEFNKKNRENYENLMSESSTQLDGYWDKNNPFVKLLLFILAIFIVVGVVYYVMLFLGNK